MNAMRPSAVSLLVLTACATVGTQSAPQALPFIEDDYPRALAEARTRQVPLFVDGWAPW